jgi:uncharacterized membrane-anchored protein
MNLQELKSLIIDRVNHSSDVEGLAQIASLTEEVLEKNKPTPKISKREWEAVQEGRAQVAKGQVLSHEAVFTSMREELMARHKG